MPQVEVSCSKCGSGEYRLIDARSGEVVCPYCRNQYIVPELVQKTETERFLEEQAKQPRVIMDNTSETDEKLMNMVAGLAGANPVKAIGRMLRTVITAIIVIVFLLVVVLFANSFMHFF